MKKQFLLKQVCGLCIGVAGTLAPLGSAQAADDYVDRYLNGYLNDPYTNEVAADTQSVLNRGAEGPVRDDLAVLDDKSMGQKSFRSDQPVELYNPPVSKVAEPGETRGAEGPVRGDPSPIAEKSKWQEKFQRNEPLELYMGETTSEVHGAQGPIKDDTAAFADKSMEQQTFQRDQPIELYNP
ncbi:MAG: hypothetical protein HYU78_03150 [Rhodocyclales bacterium]|nr:hypothetical protein [Rhodocyclales bacterium]